MKIVSCEKCGSRDFFEKDGYRVCCYCLTKYIIQAEDVSVRATSIAIDEDVKRLLQKCRDDPAHAGKYASLALDIDPNNAEAKEYLY